MTAILEEMAKLLASGTSFVVATLFDKTGSAPRSAGAKMLVRPDGSTVGTIGGGRLEADALRAASAALAARRTTIHPFDLTGQDVAGADMICGGRGEVLVDFVDAGDEGDRAVLEAAREALERGEEAWLVTALGGPRGRRQGLVWRGGTVVGELDADRALLARLTAGAATIAVHGEASDGRRFLVEPVRRPATAYVFGAGHVAQQIAPLCQKVGFRTVVLDDRPELASRERFPRPTELVTLPSFDALPPLPVDEDSYLVIVTRGHLHDRIVLEQALRTRAGYVGMIGSRRKRDAIYRALLEGGFRPEDLARVHCPIGLDILAETPEEIAVSVVGELIRARAEREAARRPSGGDRGR